MVILTLGTEERSGQVPASLPLPIPARPQLVLNTLALCVSFGCSIDGGKPSRDRPRINEYEPMAMTPDQFGKLFQSTLDAMQLRQNVDGALGLLTDPAKLSPTPGFR